MSGLAAKSFVAHNLLAKHNKFAVQQKKKEQEQPETGIIMKK
jgi:hypothetical protein